MTRAEEEARLAVIEEMSRLNAEFKATFREAMERQWMLEDAGVTDMWRWKGERMVKREAGRGCHVDPPLIVSFEHFFS